MNEANAIVLGFTFKEDCPDTRNSKVIDIVNELRDYNVNVSICDPVADKDEAYREYGISLVDWDSLPKSNLLIVAVSHSCFKQIDLDKLLSNLHPNAVIFDVKSILPKDKILRRGYTLCRL